MTEEPEEPSADAVPERDGISRRGLLGLFGAGAAGLAIGGGAGAGIALAAGAATASAAGGRSGTTYPFYGEHQAGVLTPVQDRLHFAAYDLAANATRDDLIELLRDWTVAAAEMTAGRPIGEGALGALNRPPDDTGEALDLPASGLTITIGFGPSLFDHPEHGDRFGIRTRQPALLRPLPRFAGDALDPARSGGDLCIQACADDPQVAVHAIRDLSRIAFGRAPLRWSQLGFGRTSSTSTSQVTARNLMGFKDGTRNLKSEDPSTAADVWVEGGDDPGARWLAGGSYLVARRIRMLIESWDRAQLGEQETIIGRDKGEGAPLSGGTEFTDPDFEEVAANGAPVIAADAHIRLAAPEQNAGAAMLRRGYNYVDGNDALGRLDAGLFFIAFQRSPDQFIRVQRSLAADLLNEYIKHVGSGIWAVPPGASEGGYLGETLFA
ncbi:MAG TPA: iron uptake transporter deferrochelatase/peroxidase subunit [Microbacteriaceae bacterium]|nr:iron uptake transporter deferrochelatase/peroxidase subunit [Microbacteriaceae bacterium]